MWAAAIEAANLPGCVVDVFYNAVEDADDGHSFANSGGDVGGAGDVFGHCSVDGAQADLESFGGFFELASNAAGNPYVMNAVF